MIVEVPIEEVVAGDVLVLPRGMRRHVSRVEGPFDDGTRVVVYRTPQHAWENRASDKNRESVGGMVEASIVPRAPGETVTVER